MNQHIETLQHLQNRAIDLLMEFGPRAISALLILTVGFFVARALGRAFLRAIARLDLDVTLRDLLARIVRLAVMLLFVLIALQNLGVELLPLIAGLGVAGAGIALALQGVLGNLVAGFTIILTRPFRVGEFIDIHGEEGRVEAITLFSTKLSHPDRSVVIIPNRKIVGEILHNYGTLRQLNLTVGVAYDTDIGRALQVIDEVLQANPKVVRDPAPVVRVIALADFSVNIAVRPWAQVIDAGVTSSELNRAILERFRASGIQIPFPQREVRMLGSATR
ncbi:MAG: mechanosensitive ion channel family protein [Planctomycetia bacterium]|nr:mechanosensitive ion channel family protein [Planctomycetia bacterium]